MTRRQWDWFRIALMIVLVSVVCSTLVAMGAWPRATQALAGILGVVGGRWIARHP